MLLALLVPAVISGGGGNKTFSQLGDKIVVSGTTGSSPKQGKPVVLSESGRYLAIGAAGYVVMCAFVCLHTYCIHIYV